MTHEERRQIMEKIELFEDDPFYPSLRSKKIKGKPGYFEFSVNMDIRIIWYYENGRVIVLFKIGHHDIIEKFAKEN
jgi:mRNA-degrading endonuclease YafQ of YafQ-DinJ toxin-antitoxin module